MSRLPKNYYTDQLKKFNVSKTETGFKLTLDFTDFGKKLDAAQDALDDAVWESVSRRMPLDTGDLKARTSAINATERGRVFLYDPESDYGHYQYEGKVYVDPITGKGAFYSPEYGFWSRPGVKKVPSDRPLTYSQPNAVAHWGEVAIQEDQQRWLDAVRRILQA